MSLKHLHHPVIGDFELTGAGADVHLTLVDGADHIFLGCPDIPAILAESVAFLAAQLSGGHEEPSVRE